MTGRPSVSGGGAPPLCCFIRVGERADGEGGPSWGDEGEEGASTRKLSVCQHTNMRERIQKSFFQAVFRLLILKHLHDQESTEKKMASAFVSGAFPSYH